MLRAPSDGQDLTPAVGQRTSARSAATAPATALAGGGADSAVLGVAGMSDPQRRQFAAVCYIRHHDVDTSPYQTWSTQKWSDHFGIKNDGVKKIVRKISKCTAGESDTLSTVSALLDAGRIQLVWRYVVAGLMECRSGLGSAATVVKQLMLHGQQMTLENRLPLTLWVQMAM